MNKPEFDFMELDDALAQSRALDRLLLSVIECRDQEDPDLRADFEHGLSELVHVTSQRLVAVREALRQTL